MIVLAHRDPDQVARLVSLLAHPRINVYLHVDRASNARAFETAMSVQSAVLQAWLPPLKTRWAGIELVDATLSGLRRAVADGCTYFMLISGQDVPLRPASELAEFASEVCDMSYIEHWPIPTDRWRLDGRDRTDFYTFNVLGRRETCIPSGEDISTLSVRGRLLNAALRVPAALLGPRRFPAYVSAYGGSQWWNLSLVAARHLLAFIDAHPDYRRFHAHTLIPDEMFFHTAILGSREELRGPVTNDSLRFMRWRSAADSHPEMLTMDALPEISTSHGLFARKVSLREEPRLYEALAKRAGA